MKTDTLSNQLRWVILLLAAAVILPTVCLLWFMNQAVKNERLAVRQKMVDFYTVRANSLFPEVQDNFFRNLLEEHRDKIETPDVYFDFFTAYPLEHFYQGMLIYDSTGNLIYPLFDFFDADTAQPTIAPLPNLTLESTEQIYERCYPKNPENILPAHAADIMRYRVFLAKRYLETKDPALIYHLRRILINRHSHEKKEEFLVGPAETTVWQLENMISIAQDSGLASRLEPEIQSARRRITAYTNAIDVASQYPSAIHMQDWPNQTLRKLSPESDYYGFKFTLADKTIVGISTQDRLLGVLDTAVQAMLDETVEIRICDNFSNVIIGHSNHTQKPFLELDAGRFLPDFRMSVFFKDTSVFEKAARQQTAVYFWTGILVTALILSAGAISIRAVNRQIQMNRLKNDFIATVTHELKTPLSSMRLLVDTLLEGRYKDEQTVPEYLGLIANENKRLSHLIDSFLTFSRMERNKQVFDFQPVSPSEIAEAGVEGAQAKLRHDGCDFSMEIHDGLPDVRADKDALVTVLVNLLENACKYSGDNKHIHLKVSLENGDICFAVKDNGIGISRRDQKRIFNRFYQVDSRLSRSVEGCGLGLSIVKFIVDAHKGTIDVESQPGQGSTFTVKLPKMSCRT